MRLVALPVCVLAALVALTACGSKDRSAPLFSSTGKTGEAPGGQRAGGPPKLVMQGTTVVGKALLVLRTAGKDLIVRNPHGGTLRVTLRNPSAARPAAAKGEHVSFRGVRHGSTVTASTLVVLQSR